MSDDKNTKEVKDEELDKVSGGTNADMELGHVKNLDKTREDAGVGGKHKNFGTGAHQTK